MCTAITLKTRDHYFGRNLDYEHTFGEEIVCTPRNFPLLFRHHSTRENHYAILGMARVEDGYPLYFDAVNEKGLAMAGLNFTRSAVYHPLRAHQDNVAHFELIPWLLGQCGSVAQARKLLSALNITCDAFSEALPPAELHWLLADREESVVVESVAEGLRVHSNPVGVLTPEPPFGDQLLRLADYMHLSPEDPENRFAPDLELTPYSRGMGAMGLPGDLSSPSRFVRAAFCRMHSRCDGSEEQSVSQFFHILGAVEQQRGCCCVAPGQYEMTQYSSCCNMDKGIYYYTTYDNRAITAVDMHREDLGAAALVRYPVIRRQRLKLQNG